MTENQVSEMTENQITEIPENQMTEIPETQTINYPNNGQSWGIVGMIILSSLLFGPVYILLNKYASKDLAFLVYYVALMGGAFWIAHRKRKKRTSLGAYTFAGSSVKVIALIALAVIAIQLGVIVPLVSLVPMPGMIREMFMEMAKNRGILAFAAIVFAAPLLEELIFRGIILDGLLRIYSPIKAIIISSILFGVVHLNPWQFITAFILGMFAGWAYYKTRSLTLPILIHFVNNLAAVLFSRLSGAEAYLDKSLLEQYGGLVSFILIVLTALAIAAIALYFIRFEFNKAALSQKNVESIG